ncbi:MAG: Fic family protein [Alphaproteobacteria bacterium]|nr:Fic family protein [Alphaproteobacteria bacterium]
MARNSLDDLPETFVSTTAISRLVSKAVRDNRLRRLASRLYTKDLNSKPETLVRANLWQIIAGYFPDALIADRTAIEAAPAKDGSVFLVSNAAASDIKLPSITLRPRQGAPAQEGDLPFMGAVRFSSRARALLDNFAPSRGRGSISRTLSKSEIETYLDQLLRHSGEDELNRLRDEARKIAPVIGREKEFAALNRMIGALLNTQTDKLLTPAARARRKGVPFDPARLELFESLRAELQRMPPQVRAERTGDGTTLPFFEAYFSNFIEGTEFAVDEAKAIVFENRIPNARPQDAHDILGTYRIVADKNEMSRLPQSFAEFERLLKRRHAEIMHARPDKAPGRYKEEANRAGATTFVAPDLVRGTLEQGFTTYRSLTTPLQRAVFMMFLVSEVHPFADGNGRVARIMMNAELISAGEQRIIIPTIYRGNYLGALKAISNRTSPEPLIRMLDFAQRFTLSVDWTNFHRAEAELNAANAFVDSAEAEERGVRLRLPLG